VGARASRDTARSREEPALGVTIQSTPETRDLQSTL
jgi:hypothetical protein